MGTGNKDYKFLSQSVILEETGVPKIYYYISFTIVISLAAFIIWAGYMQLDEVAVGKGQLLPVNDIVKVQHLSGGVIKKIIAKNGNPVKKGDVLIELDGTNKVERMSSLKTVINSLYNQMAIVDSELVETTDLVKTGLESKQSLLRLENRRLQLYSEIGTAKSSLSIYQKEMDDLTILSPIDGIIHNLYVKNTGEIIPGGVTLLEIVPEKTEFYCEAKIPPHEIGNIQAGQKVVIKLTAYDFSRFGTLSGFIENISASTIIEKDNSPFYKIIIKIDEKSVLEKPKGFNLISGMTLTAEVVTGKKSLLEYILKPVLIIANRSLREK